ncbi:MAG TPA: alpha/beta hydrolase [Candidatus Acidoferrum sp.]|nr:alpha/beta hydrolase [Candidatus Acidoferrum sp.]
MVRERWRVDDLLESCVMGIDLWTHLRHAVALSAIGLAGVASLTQQMESDVPYGRDPEQKMDLFLPTSRDYPTVIFVHGGSLTSGDKTDEDYGKVCTGFPAVGIGCISVNYRLAPQHIWPAQADDVASAIAWVHANIAPRGGDPTRLFLLGHSSGATLVALVGTDERYLAQNGMKLSQVRGVIPMGSIMYDEELDQTIDEYGRKKVEEKWVQELDNRMFAGLDQYEDHWPIRHIHTGMPPFLFLIAETEQEHPPVLKTNRRFVEDARRLGNDADYKVLSGRKHYTAIRKLNEPGDAVFAIVIQFIEQHTMASSQNK